MDWITDMKEAINRDWLIRIGAVLAAVAASICCILPVAVAVLGVGSAALGTQLEPFRPYLTGLTVTLLGVAFYHAYRPRRECQPGETCAVPANRRRQRLLVWAIAVVSLVLLTFPYYVNWIL